jgi:hypothetical protein
MHAACQNKAESRRIRSVDRGANAWNNNSSNANDDLMINRLLAHKVKDTTGLQHYLPAVVRFLDFVENKQLHFTTDAEQDAAMSLFLSHMCYNEDRVPTYGAYAMSGLVYLTPEKQNAMPRSWAALLSWQRGHVGGEGQPEAEETLGCIYHALVNNKCFEEADALLLALDGYLREHDLFSIRCQDIVFGLKRADGRPDTAIKLGVATRGESAKTGMHQGVRIDYCGTIDMLIRRIKNRQPTDKLYKTNAVKYRELWLSAIKEIKQWPDCSDFSCGPPHSVRHTGASRDASTGYRSIWQIQRRGRWSSEKSVLRYSKSHAWVSAHSRVPQAAFKIGAVALSCRGFRPDTALE